MWRYLNVNGNVTDSGARASTSANSEGAIMNYNFLPHSRRQFLGGLATGAAMFTTPGLFAETLAITPRLTEGPFYPDKMPLDTDNDLIIVNDAITPALGEVTHLTGKILTSSGTPVRNAFVEIWQVDNGGVYLNSHDSGHDKRDSNFQGYGRFLTDAEGNYYFRTIKPVPYPGRTPHIHFGVSKNGKRIYTTQLFIKGHPLNQQDGIYQDMRDQAAKDSVTVDFKPIKDSTIGELAAKFDIMMGVTPEDPKDAPIKGGIGKSEMAGGGDRGGPGGGPGGGPPGGRGPSDRGPGGRGPGGGGRGGPGGPPPRQN
jgi:protocatechuate 3,4-dioxygenase beta subunit